MQFRDLGRLRVIRRMEGRGKEINIVSETFGGGVVKLGSDILRTTGNAGRGWECVRGCSY